MNIIVTNKHDISKATYNCPHIVISVNADGDFPPIPQNNCQGVLRLTVADVREDMHRRGDFSFNIFEIKKQQIFNDFHARQILEFISGYIDSAELIVCQCDAGKSRSAAIAAALSKILNNTDGKFFEYPYMPNQLIYKTIINEYHRLQDRL